MPLLLVAAHLSARSRRTITDDDLFTRFFTALALVAVVVCEAFAIVGIAGPTELEVNMGISGSFVALGSFAGVAVVATLSSAHNDEL